jgi:signal transduction histidine kinase
MTPEMVTKLFRLDTTFSTVGTANEHGTGLGLILCNEFILKNRGSIYVQSEYGFGSTFRFTLPLSD